MRYLAILLLLPLAACATLSEDQCREGDWYAIGLNDGADGRSPDFIRNHAKACADYGVMPDRSLWEKGRQEGLALYCRPSRAWKEGARGRHLKPVCPPEIVPRLERANWRGLTYHRIGEDINDAERDISQINSELANLPADDPARGSLLSRRAYLRLQIVTLRAQRAHYRY